MFEGDLHSSTSTALRSHSGAMIVQTLNSTSEPLRKEGFVQLPAKPAGSWLAEYVQEYGERKSADKQFLLVSYKFPERPNRMFYYRLEHLLTVVSGRRPQKSVIIIPERALHLVQSLCNEYGGKVFAAKYGGETVGE